MDADENVQPVAPAAAPVPVAAVVREGRDESPALQGLCPASKQSTDPTCAPLPSQPAPAKKPAMISALQAAEAAKKKQVSARAEAPAVARSNDLRLRSLLTTCVREWRPLRSPETSDAGWHNHDPMVS